MEVLKYDSKWDDLHADDGIVIKKCKAPNAEAAWRTPQFKDWIYVQDRGHEISILITDNADAGKYGNSLTSYLFGDEGTLIGDVLGRDWIKLLRDYDGVFIDVKTLYDRYEDLDEDSGEELDTTDIVKPFNY